MLSCSSLRRIQEVAQEELEHIVRSSTRNNTPNRVTLLLLHAASFPQKATNLVGRTEGHLHTVITGSSCPHHNHSRSKTILVSLAPFQELNIRPNEKDREKAFLDRGDGMLFTEISEAFPEETTGTLNLLQTGDEI